MDGTIGFNQALNFTICFFLNNAVLEVCSGLKRDEFKNFHYILTQYFLNKLLAKTHDRYNICVIVLLYQSYFFADSKGKQKIVNILERKTIFNKVGKCLYSTGNADPVFFAHSRG